MALRPSGLRQKTLRPDPDLEDRHNEVFGLRPEDIGVPLSGQGLRPVARRQTESAPTVAAPAEPAEGQGSRQSGEGSV